MSNRWIGDLDGTWLRWVAAGLAVTGMLAACAVGDDPVEDDGSTTEAGPTTTTSGSGGGDGGQGGQGGQGGDPYPCGIDCGTIDVPDCKQAICDTTSLQCIVVDQRDGAVCDDGLFCTVNDACVAGSCEGGGANDCGISAQECHEVVCDEVAKTCMENQIGDGMACTSADLCQVNATCSNGLCIGTPKDCFFAPVPDECHVAICNPMNGICEPQIGNEGLPCTDINDLCTVNKTCAMGVCVGGNPMDCSTLTQGCFNGVCDTMTGQCFQDPIMPGQQCAEATDDCNTGICDMNGNCNANPTNEGGMCNDGLTCTTGTTCTQGTCGGGMSTINIYFSEDFSSNSAGWTLGPEWQIGSATASSGGVGNPDPSLDHSSSADNGVAGVVIGGNASTASTHPFQYITSPPIDTSTVAGPMILSYWRWLNSDYTRYMQNQVEVSPDGINWTVLWQSGPPPAVQDATWAHQQHDIAAYKGTNMQVRFGFDIGSTGVYTCSSWNLDDVLIASGTCQ